MENKYFTPDIEDLHVGYECEIYAQCTSKMIRKVEWHSVKVSYSPEMSKYVGILQCKKLIKTHHIRTPYLTKEQIEAEGWHSPEIYRDGGTLVYKKGKNEITFRGENKIKPSTEIVITELFEMMDKTTRHILFKGECKDINTFRKIIKLLGI